MHKPSRKSEVNCPYIIMNSIISIQLQTFYTNLVIITSYEDYPIYTSRVFREGIIQLQYPQKSLHIFVRHQHICSILHSAVSNLMMCLVLAMLYSKYICTLFYRMTLEMKYETYYLCLKRKLKLLNIKFKYYIQIKFLHKLH